MAHSTEHDHTQRLIAEKTAKVAISLLYYAADNLRTLGMRLFGQKPPGRFVVLYYHAVPPHTRRRLAQQMNTVARYARTVAADYGGPLERGQLYVAITFDDAFQSVADNALPELAERSLPATIFVPVGFIGRAPDWMEEDAPDRQETVMTVGQLHALPSELITLGSHSITHPCLTQVDDERVREEIAGSRQRLEELLGKKVELFAFPHGAHDDRVVDECRKAGYERVFSIMPHLAEPAGKDFVRGRVSVDPQDGALEFFLKMRGAYAWMPHASALKRILGGQRRPSDPSAHGAHL